MAKQAPPGNTPRKAATTTGPAMATSAARRTDTLLAGSRPASPAGAPQTGTPQTGTPQAGTRQPGPAGPPAPRTEAPRHPYGPRPLAALMPALTRPAFKRRSPATAQLMLDWTEIVGPALAAAAIPKRLSGTTLTLACSGPAALELQHLSAAVIGRINTHLGRTAVEHLRFVQDGAPPPPPPPPRRLPPVAVDGLPDGELRDALARLGGAIAGREAPDGKKG